MVTALGFMLGICLVAVAFFVYQTVAERPRTLLEVLMGFSTSEMGEEEAELFENMKISIKYGVMCKGCGAIIHPRARSQHAGYHDDIQQLYLGLGATPDASYIEERAKAMAVEIIKEMHRGERTRSA